MRIAVSALAVLLAAPTASAFSPAITRTRTTRGKQSLLSMSVVEQDEQQVTKKEERLRFMQSDRFYRKGFKEVREAVEDVMGEQFKSSTVNELKSSNYVMERDGVKVYLAKVRVKRMAMEAYQGIVEDTPRFDAFLKYST